jgi:hypothetical protein
MVLNHIPLKNCVAIIRTISHSGRTSYPYMSPATTKPKPQTKNIAVSTAFHKRFAGFCKRKGWVMKTQLELAGEALMSQSARAK